MPITTEAEKWSALGYPGGWFYVAPEDTVTGFDTVQDLNQWLGLFRTDSGAPKPPALPNYQGLRGQPSTLLIRGLDPFKAELRDNRIEQAT